ncbi:hypothetical protein MRB53_026503 [Persea americana]|uniref:Uncharacterized protein n=1 Tax=Persea americana TaxID=3435 RepID=A0ACC2LJA4_PERAE|nr:hypothetical protein MRB53_026503 [Persea americana]
MGDYYLNLLDWSIGNILAITLGNTVYLWNASNGFSSELLTVDEENGPVTRVSWAPGGQHIAVVLNSSVVDLWDTTANQKLTTLQGGHQGRVGPLSWNNQILTTGGSDSIIINNDVRVRRLFDLIDTGSQVSSLLWSKKKRGLLSSHAAMQNQLILWKYPSMDKIAELNDDVSRVLLTAQSPNGCIVAFVGDEMLMF